MRVLELDEQTEEHMQRLDAALIDRNVDEGCKGGG